ncbi:T9SS type A sorting domain-containing protein [Rhodocaloribacter litoris]|uniref:T9SS type A sorting domain-containing protein n=1 Tax=Rhodocaloribacter litoris TaxID=2558931 RepID=UPI00141FFDAB|nr:T9SS type A sorting domain-containing protein [Rhodocaloribacter litoris]QXD14198.1 T9SS type A sorting domain-containing protein [Rhodocaloribacter litoris]
MRRLMLPALLVLWLPATPAPAQQILDVYGPRLAVATDGSYALAYVARVQRTTTADNVAVQRYAADGTPLGPLHLFEGESCSSLSLWSSDFMYHPEPAFLSDGTLLVAMTHEGWLSLVGTDDVYTSETTLGAVDPSGQLIDLNDSGNCVQYELIFPGGGRQTRPRIAIGPDDTILITHQGFFQDADFNNVAIRILDTGGNEIVEEGIPHDDPLSRAAFHQFPDIAASSAILLAVWHECALLDNRGNTNDCDIGAQFFDPQTLAFVGGNLKVNDAGVNQPGSYSLWPSAAMNASGQSVVVWADTRTGFQGDVFAQRFDAGGRRLGTNLQVSTGHGEIVSRPEVALLPDGRFMVVWGDSSAVGFRAWSRLFSAAGEPLGAPVLLAEGDAGMPAVAAGPSGFLTAWVELEGPGRTIRTGAPGLPIRNEPRDEPLPQLPTLEAVYPHPFTERAMLQYTLPRAGPVQLRVYDLLGREVRRLVDAVQGPGRHTVQLPAEGLPPGAYLVRLQQAGHTALRIILRAP